jgi:hypothetical protein
MASIEKSITSRLFFVALFLAASCEFAVSQDLEKKIQESMEVMLQTHEELSPKFAVVTELLATYDKKPDPTQPAVVSFGRVILFQSEWKTKELSKSLLYGVTWNPETDATGINSTWEFQLFNGKKGYYYHGGLINQFRDISKLPSDERKGEKRRFYYKRFAPLAMPLTRYALYMTGNATEESLMAFALDAKTMNTSIKKGMIHGDFYFDRNKATAPIYSTVVLDPSVGNMPILFETFRLEEPGNFTGKKQFMERVETKWGHLDKSWGKLAERFVPIEIKMFENDLINHEKNSYEFRFAWLPQDQVNDSLFDPSISGKVAASGSAIELFKQYEELLNSPP